MAQLDSIFVNIAKMKLVIFGSSISPVGLRRGKIFSILKEKCEKGRKKP